MGIQNKKKNLLSSISSVMVIMVLARLMSLLSTQVYMWHFGASDVYMNIYSYVISIPNIIFTCIGTALSTVVIPIYMSHTANGETAQAKRFADNIITISLALTAALVLIGIAISPLLPRFTDFGKTPETYSYATKALMIMMPVMFFYGLGYIFQGMLQAMDSYKLPAFVSVPSSLVVILYVFLFADKFGITGLLIATVIGLSLQAIILIPPLIKKGYHYRPRFELKHPDIKNALKLTGPVLFGVSAYQLNMFYNVTMIARFEGMVTLLTYVQNIVLYMVLAIIYSITAVLYPRLTESASTNNMAQYKKDLGGILGAVCALLIPMTAGFIAVREPLLRVIAQYGNITEADISKAAILLAAYAIGILGIGLKEILDRAFYALQDTKTSAVTGFIIMLINICLSLVLMQFLGAYGIPLAYSVSSLCGSAILLWRMKKKIGSFALGFGKTLLKCILAAGVMLGILTLLHPYILALGNDGILWRILRLGTECVTGVLIYYLMALLLRITQVTDTVKNVILKFFKRGA